MIEKNKINLDLSDRPILNQLLETNMFAKKELDKAGEEYFLLATPCEEDLRINVTTKEINYAIYLSFKHNTFRIVKNSNFIFSLFKAS